MALPALADPHLHALRAQRRAALKAVIAAKSDAPASFGVLVIPVDFADARFDAAFDPDAELAPRLDGDTVGALGHYFGVASQGRTALAVTLAPVVSLAGPRQDYSDIGWQGNERSRRLAREALEAARDRGVDFAAADRDGDGEVDGVLLLHAAPGRENDASGLILPLQYYLSEPVAARGTGARSFAVAAARSTLGIWAHETAHLLGLEDRYDPGLAGDGETGPRGGLGRFSLMASGWLGTGEGTDPALPDAYSRLAVGWAELGADPGAGKVVRPRLDDPASAEYFIAEQRDPTATAPYDAGLPDERLLVYHVDTTLAEGEASAPVWPRHLRVQLVEADGGSELARGENEGTLDDLFPFPNPTQPFSDQTIPDARTWAGEPTGADITVSIATGELVYADAGRSEAADLRLRVVDPRTLLPVARLADDPALPDTIPDARTWAGEATGADITVSIATGDLVYTDAGRSEAADLRLSVLGPRTLLPVARLADDPALPDTIGFAIRAEDTTWGDFASGATATGELVRTEAGGWVQYRGPELTWRPAGDLPDSATTPFTWTLAGGALPGGAVSVLWNPDHAALDLAGDWPGAWRIAQPSGDTGTTWHRWPAGGGALPAGPLLACTGAAHTSGAGWPEVRYGNDAHARLESPLLGTDLRWVELLHSAQLELLHPGAAVDGVSLSWVHSGGTVVAATPVDGWTGSVDPRARHPLAGRPTFASGDSLAADASPRWRREVVPLPDPAVHGPGPWRLRLELASNPVYRDRGWLVRELAAHLDAPPASAFPLRLDAAGLHWTWAVADQATCFTVQRSDDGGVAWIDIADRTVAAGDGGEHLLPRGELGLRPGLRSRLRVVAGCGQAVISPAIIAMDAAEPSLSPPRPNPCSTWLSIDVDGAGDPDTRLDLYDLRGRRIRRWHPGSEAVEVIWRGEDAGGRRVAAGVYIFRLLARGRTLTSKVTWLP